MDKFTIRSSVDDSQIEFSDRLPEDPEQPLESFAVKVTERDLFASTTDRYGYTGSHPSNWFLELAEKWDGWQGERNWESRGGELRLAATHDRRGHISIKIQLRSGALESDWSVAATVMVEAGRLDCLAKHAVAFFGEEGRYE